MGVECSCRGAPTCTCAVGGGDGHTDEDWRQRSPRSHTHTRAHTTQHTRESWGRRREEEEEEGGEGGRGAGGREDPEGAGRALAPGCVGAGRGRSCPQEAWGSAGSRRWSSVSSPSG